MELSMPLSGARFCVVGNINRDIKTSPIASGDDVLRDGETSIDSIVETIGGGGANSACAAAALGAKVRFVGRVGNDALGDRLARTMQKWGVDARLERSDSHPTGSSIGLSFATGQRHFISALPNAHAFRFDDIDLTALDGCDHLLRADIWFSESMLFGGNERLLRAAAERGIPTSIDLNWDPKWGRAPFAQIDQRKQAVRELLPLVTLAHGNIRELNEFAGSSSIEETLRRLTKWGMRAVVVHMGTEGAGYYAEGKLTVQPPSPISRQVNSAGTGDVLSTCMMLMNHRADIAVLERLRIANQIVAEFIEGARMMLPLLES